MSYTQEHGFNTDIGIRLLYFKINYATDISSYTFTIYGKNKTDGLTDSWTGTVTYTAASGSTPGYLEVTAQPDATMSTGGWVFHIVVSTGTKQFTVGPFPNDTDRKEIKSDDFS